MSALSQKQTFAPQKAMSAFPPKRTSGNSSDELITCAAAPRCRSPLSTSSEIEHNPPKARSHVLLGEAEFGAHLQHSRVFDQHIAIHAPQTFLPGVIDDALHQ